MPDEGNRFMMSTPLRLIAGTALAFSLLAAPAAEAGPFSGLVVFGDSLSDGGNNAAAGLINPFQVVTGNGYIAQLAYPQAGTYSNGPVWADRFAQLLGVTLSISGVGGTNYANGGASTGVDGPIPTPGGFGYPFSIRTQVQLHLAAVGGTTPSDALYVVAGGGNNARDALQAVATLDPTNPLDAAVIFSTLVAATTEIRDDLDFAVDALRAAGARNIVVWNLPNLGLVPAVDTPLAKARAEAATRQMSDALSAFFATEPDVTVFDLFGFGSAAAADPAALGLSDVVNACGRPELQATCGTSLWWDGIHPSARAHELIATAMADLLDVPVPEPRSVALFAMALLGLAVLARGRAGT
jgi:outer membrane lipase/esterase